MDQGRGPEDPVRLLSLLADGLLTSKILSLLGYFFNFLIWYTVAGDLKGLFRVPGNFKLCKRYSMGYAGGISILDYTSL